MAVQPDFSAENGAVENSQFLSLGQAASHIQKASSALRTELSNQPFENLSAQDKTFSNLIDSPASLGLIRQLGYYGVDGFNAPAFDESDSRATLRTVFDAGNMTLRDNGIPNPNLDLYNRAANQANLTSRPFGDIVNEMEARQPFGVRSDFGDLNRPISFEADNITGVGPQNLAFTGAQSGATQGAGLGDNFEPQNYQEYDVHLMANPIAATGYMASHAYVLVVPKGTDVSDVDNVRELVTSGDGFVTRGGPDGGLFVPGSSSASPSESSQSSGSSRSSQSSDSSVESSGSSSEADSDGRTPEGDVYVSDFVDSADVDLSDSSYKMQTITVRGNLADMRSRISNFRDDINDADINYYFTSQNSNTYAGDAFELLTGEEPERSGWRPTPGLDNDLMDYENTDYSADFS